MFKKILIANRGDIAVSAIRACRELDIKTVTVYSSADAESLHVNLADESYCIGPADPAMSYCNIDAILCTAVNSGADAVFVGCGFLSESIELAKRCEDAGITFVGTKAETLEKVADGKAVRAISREAGMPVSEKKLKGRPKEIDIQLVCDSHGTILVVGDRDSSYQNSSNRLIGESPAPCISDKTRKRLYRVSKKIAEMLGFVGVGSVNYYVDENGRCCFKRFVPRLQVGCAITETQHRVNLIKSLIRISAGEPINFAEGELNTQGHTIGCRIYAVHPVTGMSSAGQISILHIPGGIGIRFDTAVYQNCNIPIEYEPLLAKLVAHAGTREEALKKLRYALNELVTEGVHNNSELFQKIIESDEFVSGEYDITSYAKFMSARKEY